MNSPLAASLVFIIMLISAFFSGRVVYKASESRDYLDWVCRVASVPASIVGGAGGYLSSMGLILLYANGISSVKSWIMLFIGLVCLSLFEFLRRRILISKGEISFFQQLRTAWAEGSAEGKARVAAKKAASVNSGVEREHASEDQPGKPFVLSAVRTSTLPEWLQERLENNEKQGPV